MYHEKIHLLVTFRDTSSDMSVYRGETSMYTSSCDISWYNFGYVCVSRRYITKRCTYVYIFSREDTATPTWGGILECYFKAQSSKLERLFSLKRGKRDVPALSFELSKMSPQVGLAVSHSEGCREKMCVERGDVSSRVGKNDILSGHPKYIHIHVYLYVYTCPVEISFFLEDMTHIWMCTHTKICACVHIWDIEKDYRFFWKIWHIFGCVHIQKYMCVYTFEISRNIIVFFWMICVHIFGCVHIQKYTCVYTFEISREDIVHISGCVHIQKYMCVYTFEISRKDIVFL